MLCSGNFCGCGIVSASLAVTGSGALGDPYKIESNAFAVVTSSTRPGSPFVWQHIFETDTGFVRVWDGTSWLLESWTKAPVCIVRNAAPLSIPHATAAALYTFDTEDKDLFGWHAPGASKVIPNIPGWVHVSFSASWQTAADYTRTMVGIQVNGAIPAPRRRFDLVDSGGPAAGPAYSGSAGWVLVNGTTDYIEMERYHSNGASAARTLEAIMTVEWKAPP
jgi:hypothetical protein